MFLRVHPSNFRIEGFTERPSLRPSWSPRRDEGAPLVEDLGSGCLDEAIAGEPSVQASIAAGVDLVCFSGDKLLGGPQAGIIVGRAALVDGCRHPLMRALPRRQDHLAALEATLVGIPRGRADQTVPVRRMLTLDVDSIEARARDPGRAPSRAGMAGESRQRGSAVAAAARPAWHCPTVLVALERDGATVAPRGAAAGPPHRHRPHRLDDRVVLDSHDSAEADADRSFWSSSFRSRFGFEVLGCGQSAQ